jgi:hypothetical protein
MIPTKTSPKIAGTGISLLKFHLPYTIVLYLAKGPIYKNPHVFKFASSNSKALRKHSF